MRLQMQQKSEYKLPLMGKLTIGFAEEMKLTLLESLNQGSSIEIDLSMIEDIDISGLQLLISFAKEAKLLGREFNFSGIFNDEFTEKINHIIFSSAHMVNGEDLTLFIGDII